MQYQLEKREESMFRTLSAIVCLIVVTGTYSQHVAAENWPGWRGPRGDGTSFEKNPPVRWTDLDNVAWKLKLKYFGHSSPVVWGDRLFYVGADVNPDQKQNKRGRINNRVLLCLDRRTGKTLWKRTVVRSLLETKHHLNSYASSTPVTDGKWVYVVFLKVDGRTTPARNVSRVRPVTPGKIVVTAYDFDGKQIWTAEPGEFVSVHGFCSCPVFYKDKLIINGDHDGNSYIVALDRKTGKTLWKTPRPNKTRSYCTPIIRKAGGRDQMMLSGDISIASYDPNNGTELWRMNGPTEQFVASCVFSHGLLFVTGGYPDHHILTIDPKGKGNITDSKFIKWRHQRASLTSYVPSPIAVGDRFFVVSDKGFGSCYDASTGKIEWQQRMSRRYSASLVSAGGFVFCLDDDGICKVVKAGPKFELVAENKLGEPTFASIAISQGQLFIRGDRHLFCIGKNAVRVSAK